MYAEEDKMEVEDNTVSSSTACDVMSVQCICDIIVLCFRSGRMLWTPQRCCAAAFRVQLEC